MSVPRMKLTIRLEESEEGGWTAQCVEIPGAISQGDTLDDALENVKDAITQIVEVRREEARRAASARGPRRKVALREIESPA